MAWQMTQKPTCPEPVSKARPAATRSAAGGGAAARMLALQRRIGNAAVQRALTNDATWQSVDPETGQGTKVTGVVGPQPPRGSTPAAKEGFRPYDYTRLFSAATGTKTFYCQGHLLNHNLGGPAKPGEKNAANNLTAFPQRPTNTDHNKGIEEWIKAAGRGAWFTYTVAIEYGQDSLPRLIKKLRGRSGLVTKAGLALNAQTFSYARRLTATWTELDRNSTDNANRITKPGGASGTLTLQIPSPLAFLAPEKRAAEYPDYTKQTWHHLITMKGNHEGELEGTLPPAGHRKPPPRLMRPHLLPVRWKAMNDVRNQRALQPPATAAAAAVYRDGAQHYREGIAAARARQPRNSSRGRSYAKGHKDYSSGLEHARHSFARVPPPKAYLGALEANTAYWQGVGDAERRAARPTASRSGEQGYDDYNDGWALAHASAARPTGGGRAHGWKTQKQTDRPVDLDAVEPVRKKRRTAQT